MQKDKHFLKKISIQKLWNRVDLDWAFHPDINILFGENGSGKSTILKLIAAGLSDKYQLKKKVAFDFFNLEISDQNIHFENDVLGFRVNLPETEGVLIDFVQTFENYFPEKNGQNRSEQTNLDYELDKITRRYLAWQSRQSNLVFTKKWSFEDAFERKTYLIETINRLFASSEKRVNPDEAELEFLVGDHTRIDRAELSSGEKQLLILMLTVLCQEDKPAILLLDEPEISLHLRWQAELIDILRTLNPNVQLIIATHSPSIFNDGWRNRVFWMSNLMKNEPLAV
jgi:predicted ATP-binding protein involved in virulence